MNPQELTQKIAQRLEQWQKAQENQTSGYQYEKSFTELWQQLGQEVFSHLWVKRHMTRTIKKNQDKLGRDSNRQSTSFGSMS